MQVIQNPSASDAEAYTPATDEQKYVALCQVNKADAFDYRERRHEEWTESYQFYRDKVTINRLTQRQSVNVPLMKYTIKTLLKDIDDPPMLYFYNRSNNSQKEVFYNEYWKYCAKEDKLVVKDLVDKKQVLLFGRSFKKLNIVNGRFSFEIVDPQDMLVHRQTDPTNLDSADFIAQEHIFKSLSALKENAFYDQDEVDKLREYYASSQGLIKADQNRRSLEDKNRRMEVIGLVTAANPQFGETVVELNENYMKVWAEGLKRRVIMFVVMAEGKFVLAKKPLHEVIGKTSDDYWMDHFPFTTWGEDPERTDFWCDGVADGIRTLNKILNSWISQLVENRTLRNFGMQFYNSKAQEGYMPQSYEPVPFGFYPTPGNPNEIIKRIEVGDLGDSIDEIKLVLDIADKTSGASATSRGDIQAQKVTLGEIQLALSNAKERVKGMAPMYTASWEEFGTKYTKMLEAAGSEYIDAVRIWKKGKETSKMYYADISPDTWQDQEGYSCEVVDLTQASGEVSDQIQKLTFAASLMPNNKPLMDIRKQKAIEWAGLNSTQIKDIMDAERANERSNTPGQPGFGMGGAAGMGGGGGNLPTRPALTA